MRKRVSGFTIIELLVVIAVIGILTTISVVSFTRYQADARDSQRAQRASIISSALEKYYTTHGEYPSCTTMTSSVTSVTTALSGIDPTVLVTPQAVAGDTNSIDLCTDLTNSTPTDSFAYVGDGSAACSGNQSCLQYKLEYKQESTGTIQSILSKHNTNIATSGNITNLAASITGFSTANLTWSGVMNASSYTVQWSTNAFSTITGSATPTTNSYSVSGLSYNTSYSFRVAPVAPITQGNWSNTASGTTWSLATPTATAGGVTDSTFTMNWNAIIHAASYTVQCSTDNATWGNCSQAGVTSTSFTFTNAAQGTLYYTHVQANNGAYSSGWSNSVSQTTTVDPPASYTISSSQSSWNTLTATSNAVCLNGTSPTYAWYANGSLWVSGPQYVTVSYTLSWNSSVTLSVNTSCTINGNSSTTTTSSNTASMTLTGPSSYANVCAYRTACWGGTCPTGTTSGYIGWDVSAATWYVSSTAGVGNGSWANTGVGWGDGDVRATTYCTGPWGTATASGWGDFGSGCIPTVTDPSRCYA